MWFMDNWYVSDNRLRALVDASFGEMDHRQKASRMKRLYTLMLEKGKEAEEMNLRRLETRLKSMALSGEDGQQSKVDVVADLLAGLSVRVNGDLFKWGRRPDASCKARRRGLQAWSRKRAWILLQITI